MRWGSFLSLRIVGGLTPPARIARRGVPVAARPPRSRRKQPEKRRKSSSKAAKPHKITLLQFALYTKGELFPIRTAAEKIPPDMLPRFKMSSLPGTVNYFNTVLNLSHLFNNKQTKNMYAVQIQMYAVQVQIKDNASNSRADRI